MWQSPPPLRLWKKSSKIPNGLSEAANQRRTDNAMTNRTRRKGQTMIYKTLAQTPLFGKATKVIEICSKINYFGLIWFRLNIRIV
jgi:hypothetical protein